MSTIDRAPPLGPRDAHVWRVRLDARDELDALWTVLSDDERARARRFYSPTHRDRFVVAHGMLRRILVGYVDASPERLAFEAAAHGKPRLVQTESNVEFNLSHSSDLAVVAVAHGRPVGVDVERRERDMEHLDVAERFFSPAERAALRACGATREGLVAGFFAAWSRKEAYLKATGDGITRGLHHFDVSLTPGEPARLLADRLDASATERWDMRELALAPGYSGALVVAAPLESVVLLDANA